MLTNHELADFFDGFAEALPEFAPKLYAGGLNPADLTLYREIMAALYGVLAEYTGDDPAGIGPQPPTAAFNADLANMVASMMEATSQDSLPAMLRRAAKDLRRGKMQESGTALLALLELLYSLSDEIAKPQSVSKKLPRAKRAAPAPAPIVAAQAPPLAPFTTRSSAKTYLRGALGERVQSGGFTIYASAEPEVLNVDGQKYQLDVFKGVAGDYRFRVFAPGVSWDAHYRDALYGAASAGLAVLDDAALEDAANVIGTAVLRYTAPAAPAAPAPAPATEVLGRYALRDGKAYADSGALRTAAKMPGASLKHIGFGEFYVQTPQGRIDFHRRDSMAEDFPEFSGRVHYVTGDPVGALTAFVDWMRGYPEIVETGGDTVVETVVEAPDMDVDPARRSNPLRALKS